MKVMIMTQDKLDVLCAGIKDGTDGAIAVVNVNPVAGPIRFRIKIHDYDCNELEARTFADDIKLIAKIVGYVNHKHILIKANTGDYADHPYRREHDIGRLAYDIREEADWNDIKDFILENVEVKEA